MLLWIVTDTFTSCMITSLIAVYIRVLDFGALRYCYWFQDCVLHGAALLPTRVRLRRFTVIAHFDFVQKHMNKLSARPQRALFSTKYSLLLVYTIHDHEIRLYHVWSRMQWWHKDFLNDKLRDGPIPPVSPAVACTMLLSCTFFFIYLLLAISRTYSQSLRAFSQQIQ